MSACPHTVALTGPKAELQSSNRGMRVSNGYGGGNGQPTNRRRQAYQPAHRAAGRGGDGRSAGTAAGWECRSAAAAADDGVTTRSVQNRTLSRKPSKFRGV